MADYPLHDMGVTDFPTINGGSAPQQIGDGAMTAPADFTTTNGGTSPLQIGDGAFMGTADFTTTNGGVTPGYAVQGTLVPGSFGQSLFRSRSPRSGRVLELTINQAAVITVFMQDTETGQGLPGLASVLTTQLKKSNTAFSIITPTLITDRLFGWYDLSIAGTNFDTLGEGAMHITAPGAIPNDEIEFKVIAIDKYDAVHMGLSSLPNANAAAIGGLPVITAIGQGPGGQIKANSFNDKYVYDTQGRMTSMRNRVFADKTTADTASDSDADGAHGEVERFRVTVTYNTDGTIKTYEYAKEL